MQISYGRSKRHAATKSRLKKPQILFAGNVLCDNFSSINLPDEHLPYYFNNFPKENERCKQDTECPYKDFIDKNHCWGYEYGCEEPTYRSKVECSEEENTWLKDKGDAPKIFFKQGDFGYIGHRLREMTIICEPTRLDDSSLECSEHMRFCRGRNIMMNFTSLLKREDPIRYKMDVFQEGDIGGYCDFKEEKLQANADHISPLQSWGPELRNFRRLPERPIVEDKCDIVIHKPTFIMKIDAINMYHHFCDFVNLYLSQHLNATDGSAFNTDVHILVWESYTYQSLFEDAFEAFTDNPIWDLKTFRGDVVCFKNVVFPLLPRMIFGLYYNTPIIAGCQNSGLFKTFSEHFLHRLKIPFYQRNDTRLRVTFLSRDTKYRKIINEKELVRELKKNNNYRVQHVVYNRELPFKKQLEITRNTDILIGIHGAGLTHLLFLPDWAALFEIYNCEDPNCYKDLSRLRGLKYLTWNPTKKDKLTQHDTDGHPDIEKHAKFANYSFDVKEFVKIVSEAEKHVRSHSKYKELIKNLIEHTEL